SDGKQELFAFPPRSSDSSNDTDSKRRVERKREYSFFFNRTTKELNYQ
ncbi:hypothetical protein AVEN_222600-1, partial [Araneus ventricosus]